MVVEACEVSLNEVIYLLGFSPELEAFEQANIKVALPHLAAHDVNGITAWYVRVDRSLFEGPDAELNLTDLNWLTPRVLAHQHALNILTSVAPLYPTSFGTLFSSLAAVEDLINTNADSLLHHFSSTDGMQEWGIKIVVSWSGAVEAYQSQFPDSIQNAKGSGINYLRQQKMLRQRDQCVRDWISVDLSAIESRLEELSSQVRHRRIQPQQENKDVECMANVAILIEQSRVKSLIDWADAFNLEPSHAFLKLETTGPWPPFTFCQGLASKDPSSVEVSIGSFV